MKMNKGFFVSSLDAQGIKKNRCETDFVTGVTQAKEYQISSDNTIFQALTGGTD